VNTYLIPRISVDPLTLPIPLLTSETNSFACNTFKVRIPLIIDEIVALNAFPPDIRAAMAELRAEIVAGHIRGLREATLDTAFWNTASAPWLGRTWLDVPWYWAETFFYRRVLEATRYFQPGPWQGIDPYLTRKQTELAPAVAPRAVNDMLAVLPADPHERFGLMLHASLWGNRTDLSYNVATRIQKADRIEDERVNVLVDHAERVWDYLASQPRRRVVMITDNAGTELAMDLALVDFLLTAGLAGEVVLHVKGQPFFVSDAMPADVLATVHAFAAGGTQAAELSVQLRQHIEAGRLSLRTHWFYATCLFYFQLPPDLYDELKLADLVILKGDANYRRLLGDAHWPPAASFRAATAYFPAPFVSLRTLKAELIAGLPEGVAEHLDRLEPDWRTNGRRGVVQYG
jgi:uncharacterized protein with ATP-grasp and redox domains